MNAGIVTEVSQYQIRQTDAVSVAPLRTALIPREGRPPLAPGDEHQAAYHVGAYRAERLIGIASVHPEPMPGSYRTGVWRLRGVAVDHGHRGAGVGALLVMSCLEHVTAAEAKGVWCMAPAGTFGFFERQGFRRSGDPISSDEGPQYLLFAPVGPSHRSWSL